MYGFLTSIIGFILAIFSSFLSEKINIFKSIINSIEIIILYYTVALSFIDNKIPNYTVLLLSYLMYRMAINTIRKNV